LGVAWAAAAAGAGAAGAAEAAGADEAAEAAGADPALGGARAALGWPAHARMLLGAVGADPDDPPTGTGGSAACGSGDDVVTALRTATALASEVVRVCGRVAWPVDCALRPEGKVGPLVRTLASHEAYYRRWARTWEFQALVKARPVAGDLQLGQSYVDTLAP